MCPGGGRGAGAAAGAGSGSGGAFRLLSELRPIITRGLRPLRGGGRDNVNAAPIKWRQLQRQRTFS